MRTATVDAAPALPNRFAAVEGAAADPVLKGRRGVFRAEEGAQPLVSSGVKRIYRGSYEAFDGIVHDAIAVVFAKDQARRYGMETATLARNGLIDVGPRVFELLTGRITEADAPESPVIIEEDAGISLEDAIFCGAGIPEARSRSGAAKAPAHISASTADLLSQLSALSSGSMQLAGLRPLHPLGTLERAKENAKIMFDVLCQAANMHERGIFHRDLRAANVCVKRYGPDPEDIRATVIDFEMSSGIGDGEPEARAKTYYDALFRDLPQSLGLGSAPPSAPEEPRFSRADILGGRASAAARATTLPASGEGERLAPTPLEVDLGYLAALRYELSTGRSITTATGPELAVGEWPFFSYGPGGTISAHKICPEDDIIPLGEELGLARITEGLFPEPSVRDYLMGTFKHFGFLDAHDLQMYRQSQGIYGSIGLIARELFRRYKSHVKEDRRTPDYESFDEQPLDLQESNYAQARAIVDKVDRLGLRMVPLELCDPAERVMEIPEPEVEYLAYIEHRRWMNERLAAGWTPGPRDAEKRTTPFLVPYEQLDEEIKDYDRQPVRDIIPILEGIGLALCR